MESSTPSCIDGWGDGRDTAVDVTVVSSLQDATVAGAAATPGHALQFAFSKKVNKASDTCRAQGLEFIPFVVEALGGFHSAADRQVKKLGAALAQHNGQPEDEASRHIFQRLSILLQKGNASMIMNRKRDFPSPQTDGDIWRITNSKMTFNIHNPNQLLYWNYSLTIYIMHNIIIWCA